MTDDEIERLIDRRVKTVFDAYVLHRAMIDTERCERILARPGATLAEREEVCACMRNWLLYWADRDGNPIAAEETRREIDEMFARVERKKEVARLRRMGC
jgi:hypothetical protein